MGCFRLHVRRSPSLIWATILTLCAFANFVDMLRLSADEGDPSRPILCGWKVLSPTMDPIASSWTSLQAARVGIDIGWLAVDCAPVVSETGEEPS